MSGVTTSSLSLAWSLRNWRNPWLGWSQRPDGKTLSTFPSLLRVTVCMAVGKFIRIKSQFIREKARRRIEMKWSRMKNNFGFSFGIQKAFHQTIVDFGLPLFLLFEFIIFFCKFWIPRMYYSDFSSFLIKSQI